MTKQISEETLLGWHERLFGLLGEIEAAHGDPEPGNYPSHLEMLVHLAEREAARRVRAIAKEAVER